MGPVTKILAGCGCLALVALLALIAGAGFGLVWLRDGVDDVASGLETITATTEEIEAWETKASAHPWQRREDGIVAEARLLTFLEVRRRVHSVYEAHKAELEALSRRAEGCPGAPPRPAEILGLGGRTARMFAELRLAQVRALAELGMSEEEYRAIQLAVYKAAGAARAENGTGRQPAEAVSEATREVQQAMRSGLREARESGVPGADRILESDVKALEETVSRLGAGGSDAVAVPPENLALFRKHRAEIDRYAMHALALVGL